MTVAFSESAKFAPSEIRSGICIIHALVRVVQCGRWESSTECFDLTSSGARPDHGSERECLTRVAADEAQVTTSRIDSRSFRVSRQGSKIVLTFTGPDDDRREYDGAFYTLIQNGKVVRRWRRVE
jgi:hypothetical protein